MTLEEDGVEELFKELAQYIALGVEAGAAVIIVVGALKALARTLSPPFTRGVTLREKKGIWLHFAAWLVLALEFELAADIIRTAVSPTWTDIGQLASIAVIRTFLNYFLEKDIEKFAEPKPATETAKAEG